MFIKCTNVYLLQINQGIKIFNLRNLIVVEFDLLQCDQRVEVFNLFDEIPSQAKSIQTQIDNTRIYNYILYLPFNSNQRFQSFDFLDSSMVQIQIQAFWIDHNDFLNVGRLGIHILFTDVCRTHCGRNSFLIFRFGI